jgi:hypothetical protein
MSALLMLVHFVLREDSSNKEAAGEALLSLRGVAASPSCHSLTALAFWLGGNHAAASSESDRAVLAAQKLKSASQESEPCLAAALALAYYVRGEVRRGALARGEAANRSFEWVDDLKRADKENPSSIRLSSLSLQAAVSQHVTPAKQAQVANALLDVFEVLSICMAPPPSPVDASLTDAQWASQLDSIASLLTYFPSAADVMAALGVPRSECPRDITAAAVGLEQILRDERLGRLRGVAQRMDESDPCHGHVSRPPSTNSAPTPTPTRRDGEDRLAKLTGDPDGPQESSSRTSAAPKLFRRYTTSTEAEILRTNQSRSFMYQKSRTESASAAPPRQFPRFRSFSSALVD